MGVYPTGKTNTKGDLARATAKPKSKMQTVTNGHVSQKARNHVVGEHSKVEDFVD